MKNAPCIAAIVAVLSVTSCQRRSLCKTKTANGGTSMVRIYKNSFNSAEEYNAAINAYKSQGYTCDDSLAED